MSTPPASTQTSTQIPFETATALDTCATLAQKAHTASTTLESLPTQLPAFSARLQRFRQQANHLAECLADAQAISASLQRVLAQALSDCNAATDIMVGDISSLTPDVVKLHDGVLAAYCGLFFFVTQLLIMETEDEQDSKLKALDAVELVEAASTASRRVISTGPVTAAPN